jgi:hypothetical protein
MSNGVVLHDELMTIKVHQFWQDIHEKGDCECRINVGYFPSLELTFTHKRGYWT